MDRTELFLRFTARLISISGEMIASGQFSSKDHLNEIRVL